MANVLSGSIARTLKALTLISLALLIATACTGRPAANATPSPFASSSPTPPAPSPSASPDSSPSVLAFVQFTGGSGAPDTLTLRDLDGSVISSIPSKNSDVTYDLGILSRISLIGHVGALLSHDQLPSGAVTKWATIDKVGAVHPAATSMTPFLNESWQNQTPRLPLGLFLTDPTTLYADEASGQADSFDEVDLASGAIKQLIKSHPVDSGQTYIFQPEGLSMSPTTLTMLVGNAVVGDRSVSGFAVARFNVESQELSIVELPASVTGAIKASLGRLSGSTGAPVVVSPDGRYLLYMTSAVVNSVMNFSIHIFALDTSQDIALPTGPSSSSPILNGGFNTDYFSPDDQFLDLGSAGGDSSTIELVSTATGTVIKSITKPGQAVLPVGWTRAGGFIYTTNAPLSPGRYDPATEQVHRFDPATGGIQDYAAGLGELVGLLY